MSRFPFEKLDGPEEFQRLCADLLEAEGALNLRGQGAGNDQGCDFLADLIETSPLGARIRTYLVQCKWWPSGKTIGQAEISEALTSLPVHRAQGLLFLCTVKLSGTAVTKINAHNNERSDPQAAVAWDAFELTKRLWKHPSVTDRYFGKRRSRSSRTGLGSGKGPDWNGILERLSIPLRYSSLDIAGFPFRGNEDSLKEAARNATDLLRRSAACLLLFEGETGSGKTGLACGIANDISTKSTRTAFLSSHTYVMALREASHYRDSGYLGLVDKLVKADILIVDDFGNYLREQTEGEVFAARCLRLIIDRRIEQRRPTLVTVFYRARDCGPETSQYIDWLRASQHSLQLGAEFRGATSEPVSISYSSNGEVLGRGWLVEKLEQIRRALERGLKICVTPDELFLGQQRRLAAIWGVRPSTKLEELAPIFREEIAVLQKYEGFIESLEFEHIFFRNDGTVEVTTSSGVRNSE